MGESNIAIVIPAKGKSRRLPGKNMLHIGDKTLVQRAVERSIECQLGRVIVSTDSNKIIDDISEYAAHGIHLHRREPGEKTEKARAWEVCLEAVDGMMDVCGWKYDTLIITLPTSPFCTSSDMLAVYYMFIDNDRKPVMSVSKLGFNVNTIAQKFDAYGDRLFPNDFQFIGSWCRNVVESGVEKNNFISNGAIYICDIEMLRKAKEQYVNGLLGYEMDGYRGMDINTRFDYCLAVLLDWMKKKGKNI